MRNPDNVAFIDYYTDKQPDGSYLTKSGQFRIFKHDGSPDKTTYPPVYFCRKGWSVKDLIDGYWFGMFEGTSPYEYWYKPYRTLYDAVDMLSDKYDILNPYVAESDEVKS